MIDDILKGKAEVVITKPEESAVMTLPKEFLALASEMRAQAFPQICCKNVRGHPSGAA
jgi:hypothetical protein